MSVSMTKSGGVTVLTLTSDTGSACPPLCQILQALCYSPVCCSVSQKLRSIMGTSHSALGTLEVMVGLMNLGLGTVLDSNWLASSFTMNYNEHPYWLGTMFILFGILCILSEKFPSPCLVVCSVSSHLAGVVLSIAGVVLYSINVCGMSLGWMCEGVNRDYDWDPATPTPPSEADMQRCLEGERIIWAVLTGVNGVLIILSVLQLCVSISCVVLGIRAVRKSFKKENQHVRNYGERLARVVPSGPPRMVPSGPPRMVPSGPPRMVPPGPPRLVPPGPPRMTIQILVGLVTVGLGPGRTSTGPGDFTQLGAAYWLGAVFLVAGILCILSGDYPTTGLLGSTVFMSISGAILAITGIVLYAIDLNHSSLTWMCSAPAHRERYAVLSHRGDAALSVEMRRAILNHQIDDECSTVAHIAEGLLSMMDILLIILTVLQLCVSISTTILGIQALTRPRDHDQIS
ncbi:hypothetical protein NHX12_001708 [Muraenolepis orangiensis]|uniref:Uncharacterized protein n=1 Tax=Muraenolepis orangiensis TaxID=630683 RepID=A0A9Q0IF79_9TELE|nr:hypothetical protein NHX12_001708 [Muraenolepis orangiensis]